MTSKQVYLDKVVEPLQIPYPAGFSGRKSRPGAMEIYLTTVPTVLTVDEIAVVEQFLSKLPYAQSLRFGACFLDESDPLLSLSSEQIDELEKSIGHPNTRYAKGGGILSPRERVIRLREEGYTGNGITALLSDKTTAPSDTVLTASPILDPVEEEEDDSDD